MNNKKKLKNSCFQFVESNLKRLDSTKDKLLSEKRTD